ncbi:MAG: hypothetical protein GY822_22795 [Deltaproteobacteria bacterium]|nr:hypothetical protein [Deltaproteobacteria bacterium]
MRRETLRVGCVGAIAIGLLFSSGAVAEEPCRIEFDGKEVSCKEYLDRKLSTSSKGDSDKANTDADPMPKKGPGGHLMRNGSGFGGTQPWAQKKDAEVVVEVKLSPFSKVRLRLNTAKQKLGERLANSKPWEEKSLENARSEVMELQKLMDRLNAQVLPAVMRCSSLRGVDLHVSSVKQTAGGAIRLTPMEMMDQTKSAPFGCRPEELLRGDVVTRQMRLLEVEKTLQKTEWSWANRGERSALLEEQKRLENEIARVEL